MKKIIYKILHNIGFAVGYTSAWLVYMFRGKEKLNSFCDRVNKDL